LASSSISNGSIFGENIAKPTGSTITNPTSPTVIPTHKVPDITNERSLTGEEEEQHVFNARAKLFILEAGTTEWKERGVGMLRLNVANDKSSARLIMRVEGILKLVLNVALWPQIKIERVGDKAARFAATHLEKKTEICSYLLRVGKAEVINDLIKAIDDNKNLGGKTNGTPEKKQITNNETKETSATVETQETKAD